MPVADATYLEALVKQVGRKIINPFTIYDCDPIDGKFQVSLRRESTHPLHDPQVCKNKYTEKKFCINDGKQCQKLSFGQ